MAEFDWQEVGQALRMPFKADEISWRVQGKPNNQGKCQALAYIDARNVMDRLDAVVGPGGWSFDYDPLAVVNGELKVAKGTITIHGISKSDIGDASNFEGTKGTVSDCLKRTAVLWGIGRYLYDLPSPWVRVENGRIVDEDMRRLREGLARKAQGTQAVSAPERQAPPANVTTLPVKQEPVAEKETGDEPPANQQQLDSIRKLCAALGREEPAPGVLTSEQAKILIARMSAEYNEQRRQGTKGA